MVYYCSGAKGEGNAQGKMQEVTDGVTELIQGHPLRKEEKRNTALDQI
jgi:hypothetical protein